MYFILNIILSNSVSGVNIGALIWWLFWLLFLIFPLIPYFQHRNMKASRLRLLAELEKRYEMHFITMIHRQEQIAFLGIPIYRYIDIEDSEDVLRAIRSTPKEMPIALILHTPGGLVLAASQIAYALKKHPAKKVVIVPHYSMSGGTLIALAADEIWMDESAVLGPLDPQIGIGPNQPPMPAPSIIKVAKMKGDKASDNTLVLADISEKAIDEMHEIILDIISDQYPEDTAHKLAETLTEGKWTHDYPITVDKAKELGLNVKAKIPEEIYLLMSLYPQSHQHRPGIEYLPLPIRPTHPAPSKQ